MRLLFINPGLAHNLQADLNMALDQGRGPLPPLGLLYVMGAAEQQGRHQISFIDVAGERTDEQALYQRVQRLAPDLAAITANTFTLRDALLAARVVRRAAPGCTVVFGGPHGHMYPAETAAFPEVDVVVLGEGEEAFPELLNALEFGRDLRAVAGLAFQAGEEPVVTGARPVIRDLDRLPLPARHLTPYPRYVSVLGKSAYMTTIMSSRGCPFSCAFCDRPIFARQYRTLSPEAVLREIEACMALGIREFQFYDDTFTVDRERVVRICELIIQRRHDISWDIRTRVDLVDPELLRLLRRAGCLRIRYGVEAGSQATLDRLQKGISLETVGAAFAATHAAGIETLAYFMLGSPDEDGEEIRHTSRFARSLDPDYAVFSVTSLYPYTHLYDSARREGRVPRDVWREYAQNPFRPGFRPPAGSGRFSPGELDRMALQAFRSFYFRPRYLLRRLRRVDSLGELARKVRLALKMIG